MVHIIPDGATSSGWQCPTCRHVYGPQVSECPRCPGPSPMPTSALAITPIHQGKCSSWAGGDCDCGFRPSGGAATSPFSPILPVPVDEAGPRPEPRRFEYTFGGFPVTPRDPGPMCKCSPVPAAGPGASFPRPGNPKLNETWIDDAGVLRYWDGSEWAAYTDMPEVQACAPSREGGMCGCGEPDDADRLTICLPPLLARPHYQQVSLLRPGWTEVFPGLEARTSEPDTVVHFRLTPAEGQDHD